MSSIYLKTAWRNLRKSKLYTAINLTGLAIATAAFLLLISYVQFERSYENFHHNAADICRVTLKLFQGSDLQGTDCETYPPLGQYAKDQMPEVKDYVRMQDMDHYELITPGKTIRTEKVFAADPSVFSVFDYKLVKGDPATALSTADGVIITESIAQKLFSTTDVLDKIIQIGDKKVHISGVLKNIPPNTHLRFDMLISFKWLTSEGYNLNTWNANNNYTYFLLKPGSDLATFNRKLETLSRERLKNEVLVAEPLKDIHLYSHKSFEPDINGDIRIVNFLLAIAFLVIVIGAANYINLTTARAAERNKEASLRRILGSTRGALIKLFFTESFIINIAAFALSLILVKAALPIYTSIVGTAAAGNVFHTDTFWLTALSLLILNCLLSGIYPAIALSAVSTAIATSRTFTRSLKGNTLRKALVVTQFTIALVVLSASIIIYRQLYFIQHQQLGMNINEVLVVRGPDISGPDSLLEAKADVMKGQLMQLSGVKQVSLTNTTPGNELSELNTQTDVERLGVKSDKGYNYYLYGIDEDYLPLMNIGMAAGENFRKGPGNDNKTVINEEAARLLGFHSPQEAIGQKLSVNSGPLKHPTIIGVMKNYHQESLKEDVKPMLHWYGYNATSYYAIKINSANIHQTIDNVRKEWQSAYPNHVFDYYFLNEQFNRQYKGDMQFGKIVNFFSLFTLFITCLGLLGLTAYNTTRRIREIGIRKVLGASAQSIVALLSKDFLKLVIIAVVIATPLCWLAMNKWLQNFAYRAPVSWWIFGLTGAGAIGIAVLTIGLQSVKAATSNPAKTLKSE